MSATLLASSSDASPRIWVTTYGLYNAGHLIGYWLTPSEDSTDTDDVLAQIAAMAGDKLADELGEEIMICDHEGWMGLDPAAIGFDNMEDVASVIEDDPTRVALLLAVRDASEFRDADDLRSALDDLSYTEGNSESDAAYAYCDDCGVLSEIPEHLRGYFDCDAFVHDMICGGEASFVRLDGSTYLVHSI